MKKESAIISVNEYGQVLKLTFGNPQFVLSDLYEALCSNYNSIEDLYNRIILRGLRGREVSKLKTAQYDVSDYTSYFGLSTPLTTVWKYELLIKERNPYKDALGLIIITNLETSNYVTIMVRGKHYKVNRNNLIKLNEEMKMHKIDFDKKHTSVDELFTIMGAD